MHAASQKRYANKPMSREKMNKKMSRTSFLGLVDSLESCIQGLVWRPRGTEWAEYYQDDSYTPEALEHKKRIVGDFLDKAKPNAVWDLGGNIGVFSRLASGRGIDTVSFDIDPACVEINYRTVKDKGETNILPLLLDLTNPSPGIGWENEERTSLLERGGAKMVMALALVHHLAISNNVPLGRIAGFLRRMCRWLIIEFVPKSDPKVQKLLATRKDIFPDYTREAFEREFGKQFRIQSVVDIMDSPRTVYLMVAEA
jgi:ribosomal protein L11 methylase PrmA